LVSRKNNVYKSFAPLCAAAATLPDCVLDGEIVCLDAGRAQFYELIRRRGSPVFAAFDCLAIGVEDLRARQLGYRKEALKGKLPAAGPWLLVDGFEARGVDLFRAVCEQDLEGIVAKHRASTYDDPARPWVKIKNRAYSQAEGRRDLFEQKRAAGR
jgi:bifunctional non-homologous end joining protein LigD